MAKSRFGHCEVEKKALPLPGIKALLRGLAASSQVKTTGLPCQIHKKFHEVKIYELCLHETGLTLMSFTHFEI